jgi:hypothetical protein
LEFSILAYPHDLVCIDGMQFDNSLPRRMMGKRNPGVIPVSQRAGQLLISLSGGIRFLCDLSQAVLSALSTHRPARTVNDPEGRFVQNRLQARRPCSHLNHCGLANLGASHQPTPVKPEEETKSIDHAIPKPKIDGHRSERGDTENANGHEHCNQDFHIYLHQIA